VRGSESNSTTVFHVTIRLNEAIDKLTARGIRLRPGLIATAEINSGRRSIASYVLYPVMRMLDEGLKEP
jgi:HlyD family secretion protein